LFTHCLYIIHHKCKIGTIILKYKNLYTFFTPLFTHFQHNVHSFFIHYSLNAYTLFTTTSITIHATFCIATHPEAKQCSLFYYKLFTQCLYIIYHKYKTGIIILTCKNIYATVYFSWNIPTQGVVQCMPLYISLYNKGMQFTLFMSSISLVL